MSRVEELNQYIQELFDYWDGKNDDFEPIPIPKEVDDEMQRDSFCGIDDGVVLDDSEYQRTGADRGGAAGDDTCGSGTESGNNRADSRGDRKQIQGFRWYVRGLGER